jgi:hypothetical protein
VLVVRNDWTAYRPPTVGDWTPSARVSVIVPAYEPRQLAAVLAALAAQSYPQSLLDTVVVGCDGYEPMELPSPKPPRAMVARAGGRGLGAAIVAAAEHSHGSIIVCLRPDHAPEPTQIEALVRWPQLDPDAVAVAVGPTNAAFVASTHDLRTAAHLAFQAMARASFALSRGRYDVAGGADAELLDDAAEELGYRLAQRGAVFVPEGGGSAGPATSGGVGGPLVDRVPYARRRTGGQSHARPGAGWVPLVTAVVPAAESPATAAVCVDRLLASDTEDLRVLVLLGPDPEPALVDLAERLRGRPRVEIVAQAPSWPYPSPVLLRVPPRLGVGPTTVRRLCESADDWRVGLIHVVPAGATVAAPAVELWRTAAIGRVRQSGPGVSLDDDALAAAVARVYGERWVSGLDVDVRDLAPPADTPGGPAPGRAGGTGRPRRAYSFDGPKQVATSRLRALIADPGPVGRRYARAVLRRARRALAGRAPTR